MNQNIRRLMAGMCAAALILSGCSKGESSGKDSESGSGSSQVTGSSLKNYGAEISVADIKQSFNSGNEGIMPLYNVAPGESFDFNFKFDLLDADVDGELGEDNVWDMVTVHTDSACQPESMIYTLFDTNGSVLTISPLTYVLSTKSEKKDMLENGVDSWGNASMYYIAIHYDMEADSPVKLESPQIIPFTVKHDIQAPNVKGKVDSTGRFKLTWDPVEGAESYNIYKLISQDGQQHTGDSNPPVNGAENGYENCSLLLDASTTETEFDNFAGGNSLAIVTDSTTGIEYILGQNYSVCGEFFVTAVVDGKESGLSNSVPTSDLILPHEPTDESDIMHNKYTDVSQLPLTLDIVNIDGSVTPRKVKYTFQWDTSYTGVKFPQYKYEVEGTAISGYVVMNPESTDADYPETIGENSPSGNSEPENNIDKIPDENVPTIIPPSGTEPEDTQPDDTSDDDTSDEDNLIDKQKENTKEHIEQGNGNTTVNPGEDILIFADDAAEEWLAINLVNGETDISFEAFPEMQDPNYLEDAFYKVYYQNPYILGLKAFTYDYNTFTLKVEYVYDKDTISQKQQEIKTEAEKIISETITDDMTDEEKRRALYDYLSESCEYDNDALKNAEENNFVKTDDSTYEDSFNSYGIIVNKKGVCQSYAYAYKLLCQMNELDCVVVTGYLNGNLPHAWNAVKIDDEWYQTDCTNNAKSTGVPYFLYEADSETAEKTGFTEDKFYDIDIALSQYQSTNSSYEYYSSNGLSANSLDNYTEILDGILTDASGTVCIRYNFEGFDQDEFINAVRECYNKKGLESKLETLGYNVTNGFIILIQN